MATPNSKQVLTKSTLITVIFHMTAAAVLFSRPIYLNPRFFSHIGKSPSLFLEEENIAVLKRNQALEEAFNGFEVHLSGTPLVQADISVKKGIESDFETPPILPPIELAIPEFEELAMPDLAVPAFAEDTIVIVEPSFVTSAQPSLINPSFDQQHDIAVLEYGRSIPAIPNSSEGETAFQFIPSEEAARAVTLHSPEMPFSEQVDQMTPSISVSQYYEVPATEIDTTMIAGVYADFSIKPNTPKSITGIRAASSLSEYGLPTILLREWNEFFDVDVKTYAKEQGGFLFSIHLIPKIDLSEHRLKQNFLFVIDRSGSKEKHRNQTAKRGIMRAISSLRPGDFFNIIYLDSTIAQFSDTPLPFTKANEQLAEQFLEKQSNQSSRDGTDIYSALTKVINPNIDSEEAVTAILISDGGSSSKGAAQRKKINQWLEANRDRITLYTATAGQGNNLSTLKMLSLASRGSLLYSDTHAAFPRKLAKLVMNASIIADKTARIELLPPSSRLPNLFCDHPYILVGSCEKLTDFTLVLEGKNKDQVFSIQKNIALSKGKQGSRLLVKQWQAEEAHTLFDQYLREGESSLLEQAEKTLHHDAQNSRR
jgi:hypothetical protein